MIWCMYTLVMFEEKKEQIKSLIEKIESLETIDKEKEGSIVTFRKVQELLEDLYIGIQGVRRVKEEKEAKEEKKD